MPKQNFPSPEFGTKFQRKVPLFVEIPEFPFNSVYGGWKEAPRWMEESSHARNQLDSFSCSDRTPTCDRQTDTGPRLVPAIAIA